MAENTEEKKIDQSDKPAVCVRRIPKKGDPDYNVFMRECFRVLRQICCRTTKFKSRLNAFGFPRQFKTLKASKFIMATSEISYFMFYEIFLDSTSCFCTALAKRVLGGISSGCTFQFERSGYNGFLGYG